MTAFIDEAEIKVKAGDGGNGAVAFRREKFVPLGGPSGGDGGNGGSVVLEVDEGLGTLLDFRYRTEYRAPSGDNGANKDMYGRGGEDLVLRVPPGTQVFEVGGERIGDLRTHGERMTVARGGRGGRGNIHFKTSVERAPRRAYPGSPGQERHIRLELKLLADVGLLGFPNVGKSSFIARVSAARPKIADYPFTTLVPNLGVVGLSGERSFVVADVPGLIKGAHAGAGLGDRFLRHLERTRLLVHLLEVSADPTRTPLKDYEALRRELALFDPALASRPEIVVLNKTDLPDTRRRITILRAAFERREIKFFTVSAVTGDGMPALLEAIWSALRAAAAPLTAPEASPVKPAAPAVAQKKPVAPEAKKPLAPATKKPAARATKKPVARTAKKPAARTAKKPAARTAKKPAARTAKKPAARAAKKPAARAAKKPAPRVAKKPAVRAPKKRG